MVIIRMVENKVYGLKWGGITWKRGLSKHISIKIWKWGIYVWLIIWSIFKILENYNLYLISIENSGSIKLKHLVEEYSTL